MGRLSQTYGSTCKACIKANNQSPSKCLDCLSVDLITPKGWYCRNCYEPLNLDTVTIDTDGLICSRCLEQKHHGQFHTDGFVTISYNHKYTDFSYALHAYKGSHVVKREWMVLPLQALLRLFLKKHFRCIQNKYGKIDCIIPVPGNAEKILNQSFYDGIQVIRCLQDRRVGLGFSHGGLRKFMWNRFTVSIKHIPRIVLLFDDVYTTGATAQSAAYSLKKAGIERVIPFVVARHITDEHYQLIKDNKFDINHCVNCNYTAPRHFNFSQKQASNTNTCDVTYSMYKNGLSLEQIANTRNFTIGTIERHIITAIQNGRKIDWRSFMTEAEEKEIMLAVTIAGNEKLRPIKELLPESISYFKIRLALEKNASNNGV